MIVILLDAMADKEIEFINKLFLKMNEKMYNISLNILKDKLDAKEVVAETFFEITNNIDEIYMLSSSEIESYCIIVLEKEIKKIIEKRKEILYFQQIDYYNDGDEKYSMNE